MPNDEAVAFKMIHLDLDRRIVTGLEGAQEGVQVSGREVVSFLADSNSDLRAA